MAVRLARTGVVCVVRAVEAHVVVVVVRGEKKEAEGAGAVVLKCRYIMPLRRRYVIRAIMILIVFEILYSICYLSIFDIFLCSLQLFS